MTRSRITALTSRRVRPFAMKNSKLPATPASSKTKTGDVSPGASQWCKAAPPVLDQRTIDALMLEDVALMRGTLGDDSAEASIRAHARALGMTAEFIKRCRLSGSR